MKTSKQTLFRYWGWNTQGDFGPWTFYTSRRNALVFYPRAPPTKPPTIPQAQQRALWTAAALYWSAQSQATRDKWELASKQAHLSITGLNLWMYFHTGGDRAAIATVEQQTGLQLLDP